MDKFFFKQVDNSSLIVFRIIFGGLCFLESIGAILTGWVNKTLVEPDFTFNFIGFNWLQPLPEAWMYCYYIIMGFLGVFVMIGYKYRWSMLSFAILWSGVYFMQKSSYNNHYYLLMIFSFLMVLMPANTYASLDVKLNPKIKSISMPNWCCWVIILQLLIVYSYASIAKLYPDWLNASAVKILMQGKAHFPVVGEILQASWLHYFIAYSGILFDGFIIPLMLFKTTRKFAFLASIFFHLFNACVFQIGIFPFLSLAYSVFFFDAKIIRNLFLKKKELYTNNEIIIPNSNKYLKYSLVIYLTIQIILPMRHHFIKDNVLWTEEGHRLSWRMMLRTKSGQINFRVVDTITNQLIPIDIDHMITEKQKRNLAIKPDFIWQFSQYLKERFEAEGKSISVYVTCYISVNGKPHKQLIDPSIDIANVKWNYFGHNNWILPSK